MENFNWLPKDYMIDFYHGDVYRSIGPYGEVRAPGPAYEATHKLYDNYGTLDRFLIMSNIAPYATETTVAERRITKELDRYTPEERYQIKQAIDNMGLQKERYDFKEGAFSKQLTEQEITLGSYLGKGEFSLVNQYGDQTDIKVKLAGVRSGC
jgi:sulfur relay (sulfurtransferase) DsrF/TusC family protein